MSLVVSAEDSPEVRTFVAQLAELEQRREAVMTVAAAASGSATSDDSSVTVEVNSAGALTSVSLSANVRPGPELGAQLVQASVRARKRALDSAAEAVAGVMGPDSRSVAVLRRQADALRDPAEASQSAPSRRQF